MSSSAGRFAPSPSGNLHLGSLVAATGSFLDARSRGERWLVRMEDLDAPRVVRGAAERILRTLEAFGFEWDGPVVYQSERAALYARALARLRAQRRTFDCSCSRREIADATVVGPAYPGTCRRGPSSPGPTAVRFRVPDERIGFIDRLHGRQDCDLAACGDFILRRRDGIFAYHLAVVVDDAAQGVTSIVRGADLLASTPWHLALQRALELPMPVYAHLPLVTEPDGAKLAKSRRSVPLDTGRAPQLLAQAFRLLRHPPPADLERASLRDLWDWARRSWDAARLVGVREVRLETTAERRAACADLGPARRLY